MKITHVDSKGLAHFLTPILVVLVVAVGGTYMLVSSHADTPSKKKSSIKVTYKLFDTTGLDYEAKLTTSRGVSLKEADCNGIVRFAVTNKTTQATVDSWQAYAHIQNGSCVIKTYHDHTYQPGKYIVTVIYEGNSTYKAASKKFSLKLRKSTTTSGGNSLGDDSH